MPGNHHHFLHSLKDKLKGHGNSNSKEKDSEVLSAYEGSTDDQTQAAVLRRTVSRHFPQHPQPTFAHQKGGSRLRAPHEETVFEDAPIMPARSASEEKPQGHHRLLGDEVNSSDSSISNVSTPGIGQNGRPRRSRTISARIPKIKYNPYGVLNQRPIFDVGNVFEDPTRQTSLDSKQLPYPTEDPNSYLPDPLKEKSTDVEDLYEIKNGSDIGSGGAATVRKVRRKDTPRWWYALKKFAVFEEESAQQYYRRVVEEYIVTKNMRHLHTITCYELLKLPATIGRCWGMTMDFLPCDLVTQIRKSSWKSVPLKEKMCWFKQICFAVKYVHECDIAHLDIKPDNILVGSNGILRLTDFGCCEIGHEEPGNFSSEVKQRNKVLGTAPYQPPEVAMYRRLELNERPKYDPFMFDYWSLGVLLFVLITGRTPFLDARPADLHFLDYEKMTTRYAEMVPGFLKNTQSTGPTIGKYAEVFPNPKVCRICWRLMDPNKKTRMTLPQVFDDPYFQECEMCIEEAKYECNFVHHKGPKDAKYDVEYGSMKELVHHKQPRRRLTSSSSLRSYSFSSQYSFSSSSSQQRRRSSSSVSNSQRPQVESMVDIGLQAKRSQDALREKNKTTKSSQRSPGKHNRVNSGIHFQSGLNPVDESSTESSSRTKSVSIPPEKLVEEEIPLPHVLINSPKSDAEVNLEEKGEKDEASPEDANHNAVTSADGSNESIQSSVSSINESISSDSRHESSASKIAEVPEAMEKLSIHDDRTEEEFAVEEEEHVITEERMEANKIHPSDRYAVVYSDGTVTLPFFDLKTPTPFGEIGRNDYMVVPHDLMVKATSFEVATHQHMIL